MLINVHNKDLFIVGVLDNEVHDAINYEEDKWTRDLATGGSTYELTALRKTLNYESVLSGGNPFDNLVVGNYLSFSYQGEDHLFKIMSTENDGQECYCYAENLNLELRNEMIGAYDSSETAKTIQDHIKDMHLLDYTNMSISFNEIETVTKKVSFSGSETKLARLLALLTLFEAEHNFETKLTANGRIKSFKVNIYKKRTSDGEGGYGRIISNKILRVGEDIEILKEKNNILEIWNATRPVGKKEVTRITSEKTAVKNENQITVGSNMIYSNGSLSIENIQKILKLSQEYNLLPSGVISQLYLESFWGNSTVAQLDNNWAGLTWTGNGNRPSGVTVTQGTARPSNEGGYYMHFANLDDYFTDYFYLLAKQGIYNVAGKDSISEYTKGLFKVGGATYDYAVAGYSHYNALMTDIRNSVNANNDNALDTYDEAWKNPVIVTSTTVEKKGAPNTKAVLEEMSGLVGKTVGNGQCYGATAWYSMKLNGAGLGGGVTGFSGLIGSGIRACDIGSDYAWGNFNWGYALNNITGDIVISGAILNIKANYGAPWYTGYYGHTVIVESVNGDTVTVLQQNANNRQYVTRDKYSLSAILPSIQSVLHPQELRDGGRVDGGNVIIQTQDTQEFVSMELPTDVTTTTETVDIYIPEDLTREWLDANNNVEFYIKNGSIYAPQSLQSFPGTFSSYDNEDRWTKRDFEYQVDSVEELIELAKADLEANCYPVLDYQIDGFFDGNIGDEYIIENPKFTPILTIKARINKQEISFANSDTNVTTLSNFIKLKNEMPDELTSRLEALIADSIPYTFRVTASNGTSFKNNTGSTIINPVLLKAGLNVQADFIYTVGNAIVGKGESLTVNATDFEDVWNMSIKAYIGNELVATYPLMFVDTVDGQTGDKGDKGDKGDDGKTTYPHYAYADNADGTQGFSLTDSSKKQFQGYYSDFSETASTDPTKYTWVDRTANVQVDGVNKYIVKNSQSGYIFGGETKVNPVLGTASTVNKERTSEYISVSSDQKITLQFWSTPTQQGAWNAYRFYSSDKTPLEERVVHQNSNINSLQYFSFTIKPHEDAKFIRVSQRFFEDGKIMFENSTIPSDYSIAPEDLDEVINGKADGEFTTSQINALQEQQQLQSKELEAKALQSDLEKWYQEYTNYVSINDSDKEKSEQELIALSARIVAVTNDLGDTKERWTFIDEYMEVAEEGLVIAKKDASAQIKISDDRISMFSNGQEVMWISQNTLYIENGVFTTTLQIGNYRFESYGTNDEYLVIRYLGG